MMKRLGLREEDYCKAMSDKHLEEFTHRYGEYWRLLPVYLKIDSIVAKDAERIPGEEGEKRYSFFTKWKSINGSDATYEKLVYALLKIKCKQDAQAVCEMLSQDSGSSGSSVPTQAHSMAATGIMY